jgi:N-acyl-L-homoserine lactone synthetase
MVYIVNRYNKNSHSRLMRSMYLERKRVFVDMLRWDLHYDDNGELDQFDDDDAQYLILRDQNTNRHLASLRLLRTDKPHILGDIFPYLCDQGVPSGYEIREITRFCLSPSLTATARLKARNTLVRGMVEYGLIAGFSAYTAVCELSFLSQVLAVGWDIEPLGLPQSVNGKVVGAFRIQLAADTLHKMVRSWRSDEPALRLTEFDRPIAA